MLSPQTLRWLHRVGYLTTLIVLFEIAGAVWLAFGAWQHSQQVAAQTRESTRTRVGPFVQSSDPFDPVADNTLFLLAKLPPLKSLSRDSYRFVAMPSFGQRWFAVSLSNQRGLVSGVLVIAERNEDGEIGTKVVRRPFAMPPSAYAAMMGKVDRLSDGWSGETELWEDGTSVAFERLRGSDISSGEGNSPTLYGQLAMLIRNGLSPYVDEVAQLDAAWMVRRH